MGLTEEMFEYITMCYVGVPALIDSVPTAAQNVVLFFVSILSMKVNTYRNYLEILLLRDHDNLSLSEYCVGAYSAVLSGPESLRTMS